MNPRILGATVLLALLAVPMAVKFAARESPERVEIRTVALRQISPTVLASGVLVFQQEVHLSTELIGPVAAIAVKEGDRVRRGELLLRLDQRLYAADLEQQRSALRAATLGVERARLQLARQHQAHVRNAELVARQFISASKFDETAGQVQLADVELRVSAEAARQAAAQVALSQEKLDKTVVRAPIDGIVTALNIKLGETAVPNATGVPGSALLTIADDASMLVEASVDEADIGSVAVGQSARVFASAAPDQGLDGLIQRIALSPRVAVQGRSYIVRVRLAGRHPDLRTGMTARVEITGGHGTLHPAVPLEALLTDPRAGGTGSASGREHAVAPTQVLRVVDGVVQRVRVDLGLSDDSHQEVLRGLADGDRVVIGPARALRDLHDGQAVVPADASGADGVAAVPTRSPRVTVAAAGTDGRRPAPPLSAEARR